MENTISKKILNNKKSLKSIYFPCKVNNAEVILSDEKNANEILKKELSNAKIKSQNVLNLLNHCRYILFIEQPRFASTLQVKLYP